MEHVPKLHTHISPLLLQEIALDAAKYYSEEDWKLHSPRMHEFALQCDVISLVTAQREGGRYSSYSECREQAKLYSSLTEWRNASRQTFLCARGNNWLIDFFPKAVRGEVGVFTLYEAKEKAQRYNSQSEFAKYNPELYNFLEVNGWQSQCPTKVNTAPSQAAALGRKVQFNSGLLNLAKGRTANGKRKSSMSFGECYVRGAIYPNRTEWRKLDCTSFAFAEQRGWVDTIQPIFTITTRGECLAFAYLHPTSGSWQRNHRRSYNFAERNNLLEGIRLSDKGCD